MPTTRRGRGDRLLALAAACATLLTASASRAIATLPLDGPMPWLSVETALIVWHPDTRLEHLIYGARLEGADGPVSLVLQTPGSTSVEPVHADLRTAFSRLIAAYQVRTPRWSLPLAPTGELRSWMVFGEQGVVNASVLDPCVPAVAVRITADRRHRTHAAMVDWLARYSTSSSRLVELQAHASRATFSLPYVRLVFETDQPFFPYREPALPLALRQGTTTAPPDRLLRVYVLTTHPVASRIGPSLPTMAHAWLSYEPRFDELEQAFGTSLVHALGLSRSRRYWLTSFEDYHAVRPGDDDMTFPAADPMPANGAPGTVGDVSGRGVELEPVGPPGPHAGPVEREPSVERGAREQGARAGPQPRWAKRRVAPATVFGVMVLVALGIAAALACWGALPRTPAICAFVRRASGRGTRGTTSWF
ncbi:MAG: hypothetical protein MUF54_17370 [Polyangiaceae bacterium]|jgi:hypothetical protein|nr:hypothetical protein [Polyangiaceae bacterium]